MKALMWRIIIAVGLVLLIVAGVIIGQLVSKDPGYVLLAYEKTTIEMSLWFFIAAMIAAYVTIFLGWSLIKGLLKAPFALNHWLTVRHRQHAVTLFEQGVMDYFSGQFTASIKKLTKSRTVLDDGIVNLTVAARSAHQAGEHAQCESLLVQAENAAPSHWFIALTRAEISIANHEWSNAKHILEALHKREPKQPKVLNLLKTVYSESHEWEKLFLLLPTLRKHAGISLEKWRFLESLVCQQWLQQVANNPNVTPAEKTTQLENIWRIVSPEQAQFVPTVATYAQCLLQAQAHTEAELILKSNLKRQWDSTCIILFGLVVGGDSARRLILAEGWLNEHPQDAKLLLTLGRLCLQEKLWGKGRTYFQESLHLERTPETYGELGRLCAYLSEHELSASYFRQGLLLAQPLPNIPMPLVDNSKISPHLR